MGIFRKKWVIFLIIIVFIYLFISTLIFVYIANFTLLGRYALKNDVNAFYEMCPCEKYNNFVCVSTSPDCGMLARNLKQHKVRYFFIAPVIFSLGTLGF